MLQRRRYETSRGYSQTQFSFIIKTTPFLITHILLLYTQIYDRLVYQFCNETEISFLWFKPLVPMCICLVGFLHSLSDVYEALKKDRNASGTYKLSKFIHQNMTTLHS